MTAFSRKIANAVTDCMRPQTGCCALASMAARSVQAMLALFVTFWGNAKK